MKKIIFTLVFSVAMYASQMPSANAIIVFDPANFGANLPSSIAASISAASNPVTAVQQTLDTVNKNILIPMRDALILVQIVKNSKMMTALITGSLGTGGLLVTDPELYLKNQGLAVTQGGIDSLSKQNGIFNDSIIGSVVASAKFNSSSLTVKLANINRSSIPSIQQNKICNDDAALSAMAKSDASLTGADYTSRKAELYNSFCRCDPNADTDEGKACAKKLVTLSNQNPSLDSFYAITQGDNAYTKGELSKIAIADDAAKKQEIKKADLVSGGGIKSKTTCVQKASNGDCIKETVDQAGSVLNDAYKNALSSGLKTAISSFGSGAGSLIGTVFTTISLVQGITTGLGGSSSGGSNTASIPSTISASTTTSIPTTTNTTNTTTTGYTQDLANNPQTRKVLSSAPMDQLNYHKQTLSSLSTIENNYISAINSYNSKLDALKACFDGLATDYPNDISSFSTSMNSALNFVSTTKTSNNATLVILNAELVKIDITNALINNTIKTIQTSNSTDEITSTFQTYQDKIRSQSLPDLTASISRQADFLTFTSSVQTSTMDGGQYSTFLNSCTVIRQQIESVKANQGAGA